MPAKTVRMFKNFQIAFNHIKSVKIAFLNLLKAASLLNCSKNPQTESFQTDLKVHRLFHAP